MSITDYFCKKCFKPLPHCTCPDCNDPGTQPHKCLSCPTMITTGDYCSQCSDTAEDIMDFVEPKGYTETEEDKIRESFEEIKRSTQFLKHMYWVERNKGYSRKSESNHAYLNSWIDNVNMAYSEFSIGYKSRQQEISIFAKLVIEYDKQIEELQEALDGAHLQITKLRKE